MLPLSAPRPRPRPGRKGGHTSKHASRFAPYLAALVHTGCRWRAVKLTAPTARHFRLFLRLRSLLRAAEGMMGHAKARELRARALDELSRAPAEYREVLRWALGLTEGSSP